MSNVEMERAKRMAGAVASGLAAGGGSGVERREGAAPGQGAAGAGSIVRMGEVMGMVRPEQERVLEMLVEGRKVTETAREAGVSRTTLYKWLNEDAVFAAACNQWRAERKNSVMMRMMRLTEKAADAVEKSLEEGDGKLGLRMLEKMGVVKDEEIGPTDANEVEEGRKIARMKKELARKKEVADMKTAELGIVEW